MTDEQIADLRDTLAAATPGAWGTAFVSLQAPNVAALLDKLDSLATLLAGTEAVLENEREYQTRLKAEVGQLANESFRRGAEAMRAAAVEVARKRADLPVNSDTDAAWCRSAQCIVDELRELAVPEGGS
jgi:hypothetical protein